MPSGPRSIPCHPCTAAASSAHEWRMPTDRRSALSTTDHPSRRCACPTCQVVANLDGGRGACRDAARAETQRTSLGTLEREDDSGAVRDSVLQELERATPSYL